MADQRIVAVGLLTARDLEVLGQGFTRMFPVDEKPCFTQLLSAIDEADRQLQESQAAQPGFPRHGRTLLAAEQIEAKGIVLREGMQCEMRLLQQPDARDTARSRKLMPHGLSHRSEIHLSHDDIEEPPQSRLIAQGCGRATKSFNHPLDSGHWIRPAS